MPVRCTFSLNSRETSRLACEGFGSVVAYSGRGKGRDDPYDVADKDVGALPPGTYYLVDRQSGGRIGWVRDFAAAYVGSTDRTEWFMLWNANGGDTTMIDGIMRGQFRLHPEGIRHESDGCITLKFRDQFEALQRFIRSHPADLPVPGSTLKAYGTVEVR
jgi:hypothetical protein